jgi:GNAT superfamily N-acetyltransferase
MNLGTSTAWQRKGAASTLVRWPFEEADKHGVLVYLDTAIDGPGKPLYEKQGFKRVGTCDIDLEEYGGEGTHTHIAMIRYPMERRESGVSLPNW